MKTPSRTVMHRGTRREPEVTMGTIMGSDEVAKGAAIAITTNITLDTMANIATEHIIATPIMTAGTTGNTGATTAGTIVAIIDTTSQIVADVTIFGIAKVTVRVGSIMDAATTSSLTAAAIGVTGDTLDEGATVITPVEDVMDTMATSLLVAADGDITMPDVIMNITGTNLLIAAVGNTDDAATAIMLVGHITDVTVTSSLTAAVGAIGDTITDITLDGTSDIAVTSLPIALVEADITRNTIRSARITVPITSSLTADIGNTKVTEAITTHINLPVDTTGTGAMGSLILAGGVAVAGELAMRQAGAVRATNTTLILATRTAIRRKATSRLTRKKKMANRQQADRGGWVLLWRRECWNTATKTKTAS